MTQRRRAARACQLGLVVAGIALLALLVRNVGFDRLLADLRGFGVAIVGVILFELVIDACNTLAWRQTLPPDAPFGFALSFWVRQAGVALNQLTPTATIGGEVAKAMLLRPHLPVSATVASLVAARTSYALGQAILLLLGVAAVLRPLRNGPDLATALILTFLLTVGSVLTFVWLQRRGIFVAIIARARRLGIADHLLERMQTGGTALDSHLAELYRDRSRAFAASVLWHVAGQIIGVFQLAYTLGALGIPTPLMTCLAVEAFALILDSAALLVPGRIGVQEAGRVLVFTTFGFPATTGLAVAVIVRLTQLAVATLGLGAFAYLSLAGRSAAAPQSQR